MAFPRGVAGRWGQRRTLAGKQSQGPFGERALGVPGGHCSAQAAGGFPTPTPLGSCSHFSGSFCTRALRASCSPLFSGCRYLFVHKTNLVVPFLNTGIPVGKQSQQGERKWKTCKLYQLCRRQRVKKTCKCLRAGGRSDRTPSSRRVRTGLSIPCTHLWKDELHRLFCSV